MRTIPCIFLLMIGLVFAEDGENKEAKGGDQFRKTAEQYEAKAQKYYEMSIYTKKLADIKRKAAKLADEGKWNEIKWDEYNRIREKIAALHNLGRAAEGEEQKGDWKDKKKEEEEKRRAWMEQKREREQRWREQQRERRQNVRE